jgi:uncharacterized membrane protein
MILVVAVWFLIIVSVVLARYIEGIRDAEDFNRGDLSMTRKWHLLKYPQFGLWVISGFFTRTVYAMADKDMGGSFGIKVASMVLYGTWVIALFVAYVVFESTLKARRRPDGR